MLEMSADDFRQVVDIDLNAPFIVAKAVIPGMLKKGHGKIINICSMMSELGRETVSAYAAAKGGLKMLTRNICAEYGHANIQCNGIGPGYIATPQTAPLRTPGHPFNEFILAKTPANRWGTTEDLEGPAVFLASDASNFVNGHILYVDGGILAYIGKQPCDKENKLEVNPDGSSCNQRSEALPAMQEAAVSAARLSHRHQYPGNDPAVSGRSGK